MLQSTARKVGSVGAHSECVGAPCFFLWRVSLHMTTNRLPTAPTANCRYRMDYMKFVNYHRETDADVTIGCIPYGSERAKEFGLMKIDNNRRVMVGVGWVRGPCGQMQCMMTRGVIATGITREAPV